MNYPSQDTATEYKTLRELVESTLSVAEMNALHSLLNVTKRQLTRYLNHPQEVRVQHLRRLASVLDFPISDLVNLCK